MCTWNTWKKVLFLIAACPDTLSVKQDELMYFFSGGLRVSGINCSIKPSSLPVSLEPLSTPFSVRDDSGILPTIETSIA